MDATQQLLKNLTDPLGLPGYEGPAREAMRQALAGLPVTVEQDNLGCLIAKLPGASDRPRIMLAGHLDEVGFMVRFITDNGFVRFLPLGGWWDQVLLAHEVIIRTGKGDVIGVIGAKPPHMLKDDERNKVVEKDNMYIDVGVGSKAEVEALGIRVGDPIMPRATFTVMGNGKAMLAKAWDDRIGACLIVSSFGVLAGKPHPNTLYGVGTVQEEVGLRGARTSAFAVDPDIGIALEVALAGDLPDMKPEDGAVKLGGGPTVYFYDSSVIPNLKLRDFAVDTARGAGIPVQVAVLARGGTDAGAIQFNGRGVPSLCIGVPARHIHSHQGILHRDDYDNTVRLLVEMMQRLDANTVAEIKKG